MKNLILMLVCMCICVSVQAQYKFESRDGWELYSTEKPNFSEKSDKYGVGKGDFTDLYYDVRDESIAVEIVYFTNASKTEIMGYEHQVLFYQHIYENAEKDISKCTRIWYQDFNETDGKPYCTVFAINGSKFNGYSLYRGAKGLVRDNYITSIRMPFKTSKEAEAFGAKVTKKIKEVVTKSGYTVNLGSFKKFKPGTYIPNLTEKTIEANTGTPNATNDAILTEGAKLDLNGSTYYKHKNVVYNGKFEKVFINRGKEIGVYGGSSTVYAVEELGLSKGRNLSKNGSFIYHIDSNIYFDKGKKSIFLNVFGGTVKKGNKQVGTGKTKGNNLFTGVDIAVLVDFLNISL